MGLGLPRWQGQDAQAKLELQPLGSKVRVGHIWTRVMQDCRSALMLCMHKGTSQHVNVQHTWTHDAMAAYGALVCTGRH